MTLIAGMICDDGSILLAGDSQLSDDKGVRTLGNIKIHKIDTAPLAWGCSGDESIGLDWGRWFRAQPHSWTSWVGLRDAATEELSRLNGRRRHLNKLAGVETKDNEVTTILLAGFINGQPELIELSDRGGAMQAAHHGSAAIGSANPHFKIALHTFAAIRTVYAAPPVPRDQRMMVAGMIVGIHSKSSDCAFPAHLLKITKDAAGDISAFSAE